MAEQTIVFENALGEEQPSLRHDRFVSPFDETDEQVPPGHAQPRLPSVNDLPNHALEQCIESYSVVQQRICQLGQLGSFFPREDNADDALRKTQVLNAMHNYFKYVPRWSSTLEHALRRHGWNLDGAMAEWLMVREQQMIRYRVAMATTRQFGKLPFPYACNGVMLPTFRSFETDRRRAVYSF